MSSSTSPETSPLLAVVVVNWNQLERTLACLRSLAASRARLLPVLVDSASASDPAERVAAEAPGTLLLRLPENRGYAAACNAGVEAALARGASHLLLLNNDTTVDAGALDALLEESERHPGAVLGPAIVYASSPERLWSAGGRVTRPWLKTEHAGQGEPLAAHAAGGPVDWVTGCALFFPAAVYREAGALDEAYFLYLEDADWCLRARRAGHESRYVPGAVVRHDVSLSVGGIPPARVRYYAYRNYYRFALRHGRRPERALVAADLAWTLAKAALRSALFAGYRRDRWYHARTRGVLDVIRGRWGEGLAA